MDNKEYKSFSDLKRDASQKMEGNLGLLWMLFVIVGSINSALSNFSGGLSGFITPIFAVIEYKYILDISDGKLARKDPFDKYIWSSTLKKAGSIIVAGIVLGLLSSILIIPTVLSIFAMVGTFVNSDPTIVNEISQANPGLIDAFSVVASSMFLTSPVFKVISAICLIISVVVSYMFSQVYYIIADNESIGGIEALKLSREMMRGQKLNLFLFGLSFILNVIACIFIVPMIWVIPHMALAYAEFYKQVRDEYYSSKL